MTPIIETKEEDQSHHELDQIDTLWANFRLPIPIATKGKYNTNGGDDPSSTHDEWLLQVLELLRLVHTMNQQYANPKSQHYASTTSRERIMKSQVTLAYSMLAKVERTFPSLQEQQNNVDDVNQVLYQNFHHLLQKLQNDTEDTCAKFERWLDRRSSTRQQMPQERDLIYDIFLAPAVDPAAANEEDPSELLPLDDFDEYDGGEADGYEDTSVAGNNANTQASTPTQSQRRQQQQSQQPTRKQQEVAVDPVEFQKQQQELLEEELASMATRLKSSTLAMNATLQTQTKDLDDMEVLAQTNLDQVTDTTQKVEDRLTKKKGWKKRLATWSVIGTVLGMWVLCFMIMRTVPKRRVGK
eukprot:CAMPEP_0201918194 /NCGR_PEP_ID=MMETSP0903-20130614/7427_1 /ASSEMBLY_ACC=CAM_ASM_000552 /TAXON_ID=420261 /ORGANISM="Thalassiosira antarctica, Strain CCMP982" /LENGTH=354 /DNA_ID=CAMNT_0048454463 /DNA_START=68 /DNA_END=1129 /DNA_ORIENTATION=-